MSNQFKSNKAVRIAHELINSMHPYAIVQAQTLLARQVNDVKVVIPSLGNTSTFVVLDFDSLRKGLNFRLVEALTQARYLNGNRASEKQDPAVALSLCLDIRPGSIDFDDVIDRVRRSQKTSYYCDPSIIIVEGKTWLRRWSEVIPDAGLPSSAAFLSALTRAFIQEVLNYEF